jgi:hypothetical protein
MPVSEENIKKLDGLFLRGQKFMQKYYPKYSPRTKDEGYFNLAMNSQKHTRLVERWHKRVLDLLEYDMREAYYAARFLNAKPPIKLHQLPPDIMYYSLAELSESLRELRQLAVAQSKSEYLNDKEAITARFDYHQAKLLLIADNGTQLVMYEFRAGKPKAIFEHAIKQPDGAARKQAFRAGGLGGASVGGSFRDVFRQLIKQLEEVAELSRMLDITPTLIRLNREPFVMSRKRYRQLAKEYKSSDKQP